MTFRIDFSSSEEFSDDEYVGNLEVFDDRNKRWPRQMSWRLFNQFMKFVY